MLESELPVGMADGAFDDDGALADPELTARLGDLLGDLLPGGSRAGRAVGMIAACARPPAVADGEPPRERADAARNRLRILEAAAGLVDERGIEHVSMEDVACAAGVGTGTLYRRFGDRAGLALALLDEHTREFQDAADLRPAAARPRRARRPSGCARSATATSTCSSATPTCWSPPAPIERDGRGPFTLYATHLAILLARGGAAARRGADRPRAAGHARARPRTCTRAAGSAGRSSGCSAAGAALVDALSASAS